MPRKPAAAPNPEAHVELASMKGVAETDVEKLLAEIADLKGKLAGETAARTKAEQTAIEAAEAQIGLPNVEEMPTGRMVKVQRCKEYETVGYKDDGRPILKPVFATVELPEYAYKIDLPPVGGEGLKVNGISLVHGGVYKLDIDSLRSVKEMVYRCWDHDRNIHGQQENDFGRRQVQQKASRLGFGSPV